MNRTSSTAYPEGLVKFFIGWILCLLVRFVPFRPPNVEPVLSVQMPFAKRYGALSAFVFGSLSIVLFDFVTSGIGVWTLTTATSYGLLGVASSLFFKHREGTPKSYVVFGIWGTLAYDAVTGVLVSPVFFGQSFVVALVGQIPFTLAHLLGTVVFSLTVSPAVDRWVTGNTDLDFSSIRRHAPGFTV